MTASEISDAIHVDEPEDTNIDEEMADPEVTSPGSTTDGPNVANPHKNQNTQMTKETRKGIFGHQVTPGAKRTTKVEFGSNTDLLCLSGEETIWSDDYGFLMMMKSSAALSKEIAVNRPTYVDDGTNPTKVPLGDMPLCHTVEFEQGEFVPPPRYVALSDELVYYVVGTPINWNDVAAEVIRLAKEKKEAQGRCLSPRSTCLRKKDMRTGLSTSMGFKHRLFERFKSNRADALRQLEQIMYTWNDVRSGGTMRKFAQTMLPLLNSTDTQSATSQILQIQDNVAASLARDHGPAIDAWFMLLLTHG